MKRKFTPRGMRRTFNDMCRTANVEGIVTKSISGHQTDRMKERCSTVSPVEQRESIGRVMLRLVHSAPANEEGAEITASPQSTDSGGASGGAKEHGGGAKTNTG